MEVAYAIPVESHSTKPPHAADQSAEQIVTTTPTPREGALHIGSYARQSYTSSR